MFIPTATEKSILELFLKNNGQISEEELTDILENTEKSLNIKSAAEGCLSKGFIQKDITGKFFLTPDGKNAI